MRGGCSGPPSHARRHQHAETGLRGGVSSQEQMEGHGTSRSLTFEKSCTLDLERKGVGCQPASAGPSWPVGASPHPCRPSVCLKPRLVLKLGPPMLAFASLKLAM